MEVAVTIVLLSAIEAEICNLQVVKMEKQTQSLDCGRHFDLPGGGSVAKYRSFCNPNMHLKIRDRHLGFFTFGLIA